MASISKSSSTTSTDPLRILSALLRMEAQASYYRRSDYLEQRRIECAARGRTSHLNEVWRTKVCEWYYRIIDSHHADISREVAYMAVNLFDRFLEKTNVDAEFDQEQSKGFVQLVALTSLYISVKAFYDKAAVAAILPTSRGGGEGGRSSQELFLKQDKDILTISSLLRLSTSGIQADDVHVMTLNILKTLSWTIRPLSPFLFVKSILASIRKRCSCSPHETNNSGKLIIQGLYENCRFLCELSACDYYFVPYASSSVAMAAIMVAMDQQFKKSYQGNNSSFHPDVLLQDVLPLLLINEDIHHSKEIIEGLKKRLELIYNRSSQERSINKELLVPQEQHAVAAFVEDPLYSDSIEQQSSSKRRRIVSSENLTALWGTK